MDERNPAVGDALSQVVAKLLAKDPAERYGSAVELLGELIRVKDGGLPATAPPRARSEGSPPRRVVGLVLGVSPPPRLLVFAWTRWAPVSLPHDRNLAILPPTTPGASDDFASFALGLTELLALAAPAAFDHARIPNRILRRGLQGGRPQRRRRAQGARRHDRAPVRRSSRVPPSCARD